MKKQITVLWAAKFFIIASVSFFIYKYWNTILSIDEPKLIQLIFERVLLMTPSSQQWSGEAVINIFSLPLDFAAIFSPSKFSSIVTYWLDNTNSSISLFRIFYYLLIFVFILFINTKEGLLSALIGTLLMEYFKVIPELRLEVLFFYVSVLSIEKKSILLFALATSIKLLSVIFLPLVVILYNSNSVRTNIKNAIIYFLVFNSSLIVFPVLTSKAFFGDIFIKLFGKSTADFSFWAYGYFPFILFAFILFLYRKEIIKMINRKKLNLDFFAIILILFYCLLFVKLTGYARFIFMLLPFTLKFIFEKLNTRLSYSFGLCFFLILLNISFSKTLSAPVLFSERNFLRFIYSAPDEPIETFRKTFTEIPENNFYYGQILNEEKRNAKMFLDNY